MDESTALGALETVPAAPESSPEPAASAQPAQPTRDTGSQTPAKGRADTYAERKKAAMADVESEFADDVRHLTGDGKARAPDSRPATETAPPRPASSTEDRTSAHGPDGGTGERPAATPAAQTADATAANNQRRAESHQAKLQQELQQAKADLAAERQRAVDLDFHNRVLYNAQEQAKKQAREAGAVRYEEIDDYTREAMIQQNAIVEQQRQQASLAQARQQQWQGAWQQEVREREAVGLAARQDAITQLLAAAMDAGQRLTIKEAEDLITEGFADELVLSDVDLWRDHQTPPQLARSRIKVAMKRNAELGLAKLVARAVADLQSQDAQPAYERTQARGGISAPVPAQPDRHLSYQERRARAIADWNDESEADVRRLTG